MRNFIDTFQENRIKKIHAAIDTAEDRLLAEAEQMLKDLDIVPMQKLSDKADRLEKAGFTNVSVVRRNNVLKESTKKLVKTKEFADLIRYYKQTYPFQKFLTEVELDRVCAKYGLVYAPVNNYLRDVPEKNLLDIENAPNLKSTDRSTDSWIVQITCNVKGTGLTSEDRIKIRKGFVTTYDPSRYGNASLLRDHFGKSWTCEYDYSYRKMTRMNRAGLFIAAPSNHFDLTGLHKERGFGFLSGTVIELKDPVVFRYCRGGVQVITKWGLEAKDELLANPIEN